MMAAIAGLRGGEFGWLQVALLLPLASSLAQLAITRPLRRAWLADALDLLLGAGLAFLLYAGEAALTAVSVLIMTEARTDVSFMSATVGIAGFTLAALVGLARGQNAEAV